MIYKATGNLPAIQILLGPAKIENMVRYLGVDIDALVLADYTEVKNSLSRTGQCRSCIIEWCRPWDGYAPSLQSSKSVAASAERDFPASVCSSLCALVRSSAAYPGNPEAPIRAAHVDRGLELEADYFHKAKLIGPSLERTAATI